MTLTIIFSLKVLSFYSFVIAAAQKSHYGYLGCYLEEDSSSKLLTLGEVSRIFVRPPISPKSCSEFCSSEKYMFFVIKNDTCYCSKNYISRLMKQFDNECSIKCKGDESTLCGGTPNLVSAYITDSSKNNFKKHSGYPIPIYLGCYIETPNDNDNRLLKGLYQSFVDNTPLKCSIACFNMGYLYFGVTFESECQCGNQYPSATSKVDDINCNYYHCSGDDKQFCGGEWKVGIYSTGITDYLPKNYVGCFDDEIKKIKGKYLSYQMGYNSPRKCMNLCNTQQFSYAAIKGNVCECKNYEPNYNLQKSFSDCNTLCPQNPYEYCGGGLTLQNIYKTLISADDYGNVRVNYIGCFKNLKRNPLLHSWKITFLNITPKKCVYSCYARGFPYASLISLNECVCSFMRPSNDAKTDDNKCMVSCSGDSFQQSCNNELSVYRTGLEWKTETIANYYLGCFKDNTNDRILNSYFPSFHSNTPEFCSTLCFKFGYTYSGVTNKSDCFCENQSPNELRFTKVDDTQCNAKCSGDANQFCGNNRRMEMFTTGLNDFQIKNRLVGCFKWQENTLYNMKFELSNTNTPSKCSAICNNAEYQFAGVMGINCLCSNSALSNGQKVSNTDCDTTCIGDSSKTCGSEDRIQIYNLIRSKDSIELSITAPGSNSLQGEFDYFSLQSLWNHDIYIAHVVEPDYDFVVYNNSINNVFVKNGELIIKPTVITDSTFIKRGTLRLNGCTKIIESQNICSMTGHSFNIIPPVISAKLTTKNNLFYRYGHLEVIAKLPTGDWIVSEIALVSKSNEQNKLLFTLFGNANLRCNGVDESASVLKYGLKIGEQSNIMKSTLANYWTDGYHSFVISWTPDNIAFKIDGKNNYLDTSSLLLDDIFVSEYYVSIGVSVGGMKTFDDDCFSNGHLKPWKNMNSKAMLYFWENKTQWLPTWNGETSTLRVKSVKFTANKQY